MTIIYSISPNYIVVRKMGLKKYLSLRRFMRRRKKNIRKNTELDADYFGIDYKHYADLPSDKPKKEKKEA